VTTHPQWHPQPSANISNTSAFGNSSAMSYPTWHQESSSMREFNQNGNLPYSIRQHQQQPNNQSQQPSVHIQIADAASWGRGIQNANNNNITVPPLLPTQPFLDMHMPMPPTKRKCPYPYPAIEQNAVCFDGFFSSAAGIFYKSMKLDVLI
jgi:hypothetical protein